MVTISDETVRVTEEDGTEREYPIGSPEAFKVLSRLWLRSGWDTKYVYSFTWLGRPMIQLPEDMMRLQEVIFSVQPDVIVETGIAHGGGLIFYASLCKAMDKGRVIGVDIEIRPHNRKAIEEHVLFPYLTLIEGSSTDPSIVGQVEEQIGDNQTVMIFLDSCHTRDHVLDELRMYAPMVTQGSYLVAMDGIMKDLVGAPRSESDWGTNNPCAAAAQFLTENGDFEMVEPAFAFNESAITERITYWPNAFLRRVR